MIQFRWRKLDETHHGYENVVVVAGFACVLEYKQHFMPVYSDEGLITLKKVRDVDNEWKEVVIDNG